MTPPPNDTASPTSAKVMAAISMAEDASPRRQDQSAHGGESFEPPPRRPGLAIFDDEPN